MNHILIGAFAGYVLADVLCKFHIPELVMTRLSKSRKERAYNELKGICHGIIRLDSAIIGAEESEASHDISLKEMSGVLEKYPERSVMIEGLHHKRKKLGVTNRELQSIFAATVVECAQQSGMESMEE